MVDHHSIYKDEEPDIQIVNLSDKVTFSDNLSIPADHHYIDNDKSGQQHLTRDKRHKSISHLATRDQSKRHSRNLDRKALSNNIDSLFIINDKEHTSTQFQSNHDAPNENKEIFEIDKPDQLIDVPFIENVGDEACDFNVHLLAH